MVINPSRAPATTTTTTQPTLFRSSSFSSPLPILPSIPTSPMIHHSSPSGDNHQSSSSPYTPSKPSLPHSITSPTLSPNYHPYRIRTSSSGVLTRSNSSPAQPLSSFTGHRSSRSMSNLREVAEGNNGPSTSLQDGADVDEGTKGLHKRRSIDGTFTPRTRVGGPVHARAGSSQMGGGGRARKESFCSNDGGSDTSFSMGELRRSGSMMNLKNDGMEVGDQVITILPPNPKVWSANELARYIEHALSPPVVMSSPKVDSPTATPQRNKKPLSNEMVFKIMHWIVEHDIQGRSFLRGGEEGNWANTSTQPPFLPILLSLSRNLRRASLKGSVLLDSPGHYYTRSTAGGPYEDVDFISPYKDNETTAPTPSVTSQHRSSHSRDGSVLKEEDEGEGEDNQEGHAEFQSFGAVADVLAGLSPTSTHPSIERAESVHDSAIATDDDESIHEEQPTAALSRYSSISSFRSIGNTGTPALRPARPIPGSIDESRSKWGPYVSRNKNRTLSNASSVSQGGLADTETGSMHLDKTNDTMIGNMKLHNGSQDKTRESPSNLGSPDSLVSPPPAYVSDGEMFKGHPSYAASTSVERGIVGLGIPNVQIPLTTVPDITESNTEPSQNMVNMLKKSRAASRPYGALRRTSSSGSTGNSNGPRLPTVPLLTPKSPDSGIVDDLQREWSGGDRRVTIRPTRKATEIFDESSPNRQQRDSSGTPRPHSRGPSGAAGDSQLLEMVKDLTQRLEQAEARIQELQASGSDEAHGARRLTVQQGYAGDLWGRLTSVSPQEDFFPKDIRQLPVYMLLVGVGLGMIVTKVLFGKSVRG